MRGSRVTSLQRNAVSSAQSSETLTSLPAPRQRGDVCSFGIRRQKVKEMLTSDNCERAVLLLILANCVALGFESNEAGFEKTTRGAVLNVLEIVFLTLFTVEMGFKIGAFGLIGSKEAYLRDGRCGSPQDLVPVLLLGVLMGLGGFVLKIKFLSIRRMLVVVLMAGGVFAKRSIYRVENMNEQR